MEDTATQSEQPELATRDLDMNVAADRVVLAEELRSGWQVTPERKRAYFGALDEVVRTLDKIEDPAKRAQAASQCARVLVAEQTAAIRDLHHTWNACGTRPASST